MRGRLPGLLVAILVLLAGFGVAKESREPYLWLRAADLLRPKPAPIEMAMAGGLAGRLYDDTRPHTGKIARLQKGLVLALNDRELVEEGFGFGLPMVEVAGQAYLARTATAAPAGEGSLVKRYTLDTVDTPSGFLRRKYEPVTPIGTVVVTYTRQGGGLDVDVDLGGLTAKWQRVYVMNEQGAGVFTRYEEPGQEAVVLPGDGRAQWEPTQSRRGCLLAEEQPKPLRYCVETEVDLVKRYGRERYNQYYWLGTYSLSWAGIDIEVPAGTRLLQYRISLEQASD